MLSHRLLGNLPVPPYITAIGVSVSCFIGFLLIAAESGLLADTLSGNVSSSNLRASLTLMVMVGYLPVAHWYLRRWTANHISELKLKFDLPGEHGEPQELVLVLLGLLGVFAFIGLFIILPNPPEFTLQPWKWPLEFVAVFIAMSMVGWFMGRFSYELVWSAIQMSRVARQLPAINLLEIECYRPFIHQGVHSTLLIVILISITAHLAANPGDSVVGAIVNVLTMLALAVTALVLPVWGVHLRLRDQKLKELRMLREHIQVEQRKVVEATDETSNRLIGLLAMEVRIERVNDWPLDMGSFAKVGLYLLLGIGSWVGAALVERMLESAL
ncbi:MAG: hypothetical protein ACJAVI_002312 [Candidatus Azotimanducaceae bacterium]|jgi:hypothetical protein